MSKTTPARTDFIFKDRTGHEIHASKWIPAAPVAILQIGHGMMEHSRRYEDFANYLTQHNIAVYIADHRGHGRTAGQIENLGYFADKDGWELVVENMLDLTHIAKKEIPDVPLFLLGHSLGSLLVRSYVIDYGNEIYALILSATTQQPSWLMHFGTGISQIIRLFKGKKHRSNIHIKLGYGTYSKPFRPNRTPFDWLSGDPGSVDAFIADPLCGNPSTVGYYLDFFKGMHKIKKKSNIMKMPSDLPVLIFGGGNDPVGNNGNDLKDVFQVFKNAGMANVDLKIYPEGRHEMLNEVNKAEVYEDVVDWITKQF